MYAVATRVQSISALSEGNCCMMLQAGYHAGDLLSFAGGSKAFSPDAEAA